MLLDTELRLVWMNRAYLAVTMRETDDIIGRRMFEAFPSDPSSLSHQLLSGSFQRVLDTGEEDHLPLIPYAIPRDDGSFEERFWSATHTPIHDGDGRLRYILQQTNDVTALRREMAGDDVEADRAVTVQQRADLLQRAEAIVSRNLSLGLETEFLRSVFDQAPSLIAIYIGPEHRIEIANRAYLDSIGNRDVIGRPVAEALPEIAEQGYLDKLDEVYRTGKPFAASDAPAIIRMPDGSEHRRYLDLVFHPLVGGDGEIAGIFVQAHDVTDLIAAEAAAKASEERFRQMAQSLPNHVWSATPDGEIDWLNDQVAVYTGRGESELVGANWLAVLHPDDREAAAAAWTRSVKTGEVYEIEFRIRDAGETYRWFLVRARPLRDSEGRITRWIGTNTDIDDRYAAERALADLNATLEERAEARSRELQQAQEELRQAQKMESIGNLAGGIAHDFNNILQAITGSLQLAEQSLPEDGRAPTLIRQALTAAERGRTLSTQMLSFSRRQPLAPKTVDVGALIGLSRDMLRSAVGDGIELRIAAADGLWNTLIDPANLENALLNLAINARDAMEGQGRLLIEAANLDLASGDRRLERGMPAGEYVEIRVTDTGCGIPPDQLDKVLEPFYTTKEAGRGTGLGLSTVYGFVRQSGGQLLIESETGQGTTVIICLPRSHEPVSELRPAVEAPVSGGREHVLVVEDDPVVRRTTVEMLESLGYTVTAAGSADAALPIVEGGEPVDLLFSDVMMPGRLKCTELADRARAVRPQIKVLYTSGYSHDEIMHDGRLDPGVNLLPKPYERQELSRKVREVLDGAAPPAAGTDPASATSKPPAAPGEDRALDIIVCEDDVIIALNIETVLEAAGHRPHVAHRGAEALDLLDRHDADLLLTDMGLPDMDGMDLARRARERRPGLPVLFATGRSRSEEADALGQSATLTKPFSDDMLTSAIEQLVSPQPA